MLDNLKLGYGGTRSEMERLLADAEKLTGVHYDIENLSDVYSAIHAIQEELGITGTTAQEAAGTISGSMAMAKAAWQNLLVGIADENANVDKLVDDFVNSAVTAGENLIPRVSVVLEGMGKLVGDGAEKLVPIAVDALIDNLPQLTEAGVKLVVALAVGLVKAVPKLVASVPEIIKAILKGLASGWPAVRDMGSQAVEQVKAGFRAKVDQARQWGRDLVQNFIDGLLSKITALKDSVKNAAGTVKKYLGFSEPEEGPLSDFHTYAPDMMALFAQGVRQGEGPLRAQLRQSFDFSPELRPVAMVQAAAPAAGAPASAGGGGGPLRQPIQVTLPVYLGGNLVGRAIFKLYNDERDRLGVQVVKTQTGGALA